MNPPLRYYKSPLPADKLPAGVIPGSEWVIFMGIQPSGGEVVLELSGVWEEQAERIRKAMAGARKFGRLEVADDISGRAQQLRLEDVG